MSIRNVVAVALTVVSVVMLVPGLLQPLITITASVEVLGVTRELFSDTRSIVQAVRTLHESGNDFVAGLILLFSILVPFIKGMLLLVILGLKRTRARYRLYRFVQSISKWSMADVFVVGVFIALLAAKATDNLDAVVGRGFYLFAGYCLVSNLAFQFLRIAPPDETGTQKGAPVPTPRPELVATASAAEA